MSTIGTKCNFAIALHEVRSVFSRSNQKSDSLNQNQLPIVMKKITKHSFPAKRNPHDQAMLVIRTLIGNLFSGDLQPNIYRIDKVTGRFPTKSERFLEQS